MDGESLEPIEGSAVMLNLFQHPASSDLAGGKLDPETKVRVTNGQCNPRASSPEIRKASMAYPISLYIRNGSIVRCGSSLSMFYSPAAKGAFAMQGLRLIAVASIAGAVFIGGGVANARFLQVDPVGYKDQVNLYAYVGNDPANATDPTGTRCDPQKDGSSVCDPPGEDIGRFTIPAKENPGYIGPEAAGHHVYNGETSTPASSPGLTSSIAQAVIENPTPGNDSPATRGGTRNDAGISPLSGAMGDQVNSYVTTDSNQNTVVVNMTVPGEHVFSPGYVAQAIIPGRDSTRIVVVGEGNARIQVGLGAAAARFVFQRKIEADMRRGIFNAVRGKRW